MERGGRDEALSAERCLGDSQQQWFAHCGLLTFIEQFLVGFLKTVLLHLFAHEKFGITWVANPDPFEHLAHNYFYVFVVYLDPLQPVNLLDFVHQVFGQLLFTKDVENVVGVGRAIHKGLTGPY